ncbi:protein piccolo [Galleria mellonella]|uniref:Protein piccolo n=1 Tax=Galleria mellonella TaxID=7137 RepID=A0A6J3BUI2_GALME|nr:protein piccolo [Galleria mellonella]XP_031765018.2 protein piccolo [Galleria mellonella]
MADGGAGAGAAADAVAEAETGAVECAARGAALERAYVHDVYEQAGEDGDESPRAPAPGVQAFLSDLDPGSLVCDVGCGNGKYLSVNPSVFSVGGDRCTRLAAHARHHDNEVVVCDNLCLPFRDESFDAVLSIAVVHHFATVERRAMALRELARVTRIGGRLLLTVWAMEHEGRNFHSQDVLIPWHRPATLCPPTPTPRFLSVDHDPNAEPWKSRDGSPGSSSLSSPNETCYSFVRRALQRLAGRRSFLPSWSMGARVPSRPCTSRPEPPAADLPIELRRLDEAVPPRLITQSSESSTMKSRSLTDIADVERRALVRSRSSLPSLVIDENDPPLEETPAPEVNEPRKKPRLVKQKKSINEDDADEDLDKPTDMKSLVEEMPNFKIHTYRLQSKKPGVFKQTSLNEELMSVERLREKERLRKNIQKQASLNEEYLYRRPGALDSIRDSIFSTSATTAKKFQSLKNGLTSKFKTSTTNIDKVTVFVRMLQGWKNHGPVPEVPTPNDNNTVNEKVYPERRHSKEDGSDSSKDSSLQSDTSVDSEDSFASVIYVPKADGSGDPLSPTPLSPGPTSPRLKVSSVPTSPRMKSSPGLPSPRIKQAFPLIRPPASPNAVQTPAAVNKILVAQYSLKNYSTSTVGTVPLKPQSKSQPNSPPKSESDENILKPEILSIINKNIPVEVFEEIDPIPPIKEEEETPTEITKELIAEINKDIEEIHKLTVETNQLKPRVVLQDVKPYPKITLQTVAELPEIPQFKQKVANKSPTNDTLDSRSVERKRKERIRQIKEMLNKGIPPVNMNRRQHFPIVRTTGKAEPIAKSRPTLMSLELFNPATDDMDSDSSGVSSPDSVDSVISVVPDELRKTAVEKDLPTLILEENKEEPTTEKTPCTSTAPQSLIEAAAEVAHSLDEACETVIQSSPRSKRRQLEKLESADAIAIIQGNSSSSSSSWSLNKLSPGDLRLLEDKSRSQSHTSSSGSSSSLERLSPGRRSKDRSPKQGSTSNSTWSLNRLSPNRPEGRSLDENLSKSHRSPTRLPYDSVSISSTDSEKSISKSESFNRIQNEPLITCKSDMLAKEDDWVTSQQDKNQHLTEFAEKLSEKLLQEIDQYSKRINEEDFDLPSSSSSEKSISLRLKREEEDRNTQKILDELSDSLQHLEDPYINKLSTEMQGLNKLSVEIQERTKYIASMNDTQETDINKLFPKCGTKSKSKKRSKDVDPIINKYRELKKSMKVTSDEDIFLNNCTNLQYNIKSLIDEKLPDTEIKNPDDDSAISSTNGNPEITIDSGAYDTSQSLETGYSLESEISVDSLCTSTDKRSSLKVGQSTDSSDLDKMEISPESITSRSSTSTAPLKSGFSIESSDTSAGSDWSRRDKTGSTASLGCVSLASLPSCSECSKDRKLLETRSSSEDTATIPAVPARAVPHAPLLPSLSDGSDSLPSEGGAVTYHRYYHVFKRGELDQLIEKYVESLHVVSSYYDQASWCVVAEKVQVWTI